jgi:hypothetical protein
MLAVPSKKPIRFLGMDWRRLFPVLPKPASSHRGRRGQPDQLVHRVKGDLRVVSADLDSQVSAADRRSERVGAEGWQVDQLSWPVFREAEPVAVAEQRRAEAEGHRQVRRAQPERLARIAARLRPGLHRTDCLARRHQGRRPRPGAHQLAQVGHGRTDQVKRGELQVRLRGRRDAGLMFAVEGDGGAGNATLSGGGLALPGQ